MEREFSRKKDVYKRTAALQPRWFLAVLIAIVLFPPAASAQALRKDSGTKPALGGSQSQQAGLGKELFRQHCASCHFAETAAQKIGPGLKGLYLRLTFSDGTRVTDASLTRWIEDGGKNMPGFKETMKPDQVRALISYLKTL